MKKLKVVVTIICLIFTLINTSVFAENIGYDKDVNLQNSDLNIYGEKSDEEELDEEFYKNQKVFNAEELKKQLNQIEEDRNSSFVVPENAGGGVEEEMISYTTYLQNQGWETVRKDLEMTGSTGNKIQALKVSSVNLPEGVNIKYRTHVSNVGWLGYSENGEESGRAGSNEQVEAVQIYLENTNEYSIEYRGYIQNRGWSSWVSDNAVCGTTGLCLKLEAMQIRIIEKMPTISYQGHVQNIGWQGFVSNGEIAGTTGLGLRLEALKIDAKNLPSGVKLKIRSHVQDEGWQNWKESGQITGSTGLSRRLEALQIVLQNTSEYSVEYRGHVQNIGWQNWTSNGGVCGTTGQALRLEAIQIRIVKNPPRMYLKLEEPTVGNIYGSTLKISGWEMSTSRDTNVYTYIDGKQISNTRKEREDIINSITGYGDVSVNAKPGFETTINTADYNSGTHTITIYAVTKDGRTAQTITKNVVFVGKTEMGIDVSTFQGNTIDWNAVKNSGIDFVMIRVGFRGYGDSGIIKEDKSFRQNITGAKNAGLKVGLYFFTQAKTEAEAVEEANFAIARAREFGITYPIAIDTEWSNPDKDGRADELNVAQRTAVCNAFCRTVKNANYIPMIYASKNWLIQNLDMNVLNQYQIWLAHYTSGGLEQPSSYAGHYEMWQYTSDGSVPGIIGRVDRNVAYK